MPNFSSTSLADVPESGIIETSCDRGHRAATVLQQAKFEILSDMAVKAIVDGNYRDAVSSFAASLERLQEFFVIAHCRKQGIAAESLTAAWKPMSKPSERQVGAFIATFLLETRGHANVLSSSKVAFRNEVVHGGRLASREEAIDYGQSVFECAIPVLTVLRSEPYAETLLMLTGERIRERSRKARDSGLAVSTMSVSTPLSFVNADQRTDLLEAIADYEKRPNLSRAVEESRAVGAMVDRLAQKRVGRQTPQ